MTCIDTKADIAKIRALQLVKGARRARNASIRARPSRALDLYGAGYDFSTYTSAPRIEYMLAAIPRSGSTHLATELWRTGVMGAPLEYPNPPFANILRSRLRLDDVGFVTYWQTLKHCRTSPNGVFGYKAFMSDYLNWSQLYQDMLPLITPDKVIFLTRSNLVEQAVSYSKAIRSNAWFEGMSECTHPDYDGTHIRRCLITLQYQVDFWRELFDLTGTSVHHVTYEALLNEPRIVVEGIADFLGVVLSPTVTVDLPYMRIQRDAESAAWVERFESTEDVAALLG
jgi:LPS sulfotransferase NodH